MKVVELGNMDALKALEDLTHTTQNNPTPVMPLSEIAEGIPALFRRAAINAALGSARSFSSYLQKWQKAKEKAEAKGKTFHECPPVPPRTWNKSALHVIKRESQQKATRMALHWFLVLSVG